jgi:dTDP-4-dehydrorhamnose 3,5-epimerase
MKVTELSIAGACLVESPVWADDRGFFREWFKESELDAAGVGFSIQQANLSMSRRGVIRGLHYSLAPEGQAKLVTCAYGEVVDVIVDIRVGSPTFGQYEKIHLAASEEHSVLVPKGAAHGFCVTSEVAALTYLLSSPYNANQELEISPFDDALGIVWPVTGEPLVSEKDAAAPTLAERQRDGKLPLHEAAH